MMHYFQHLTSLRKWSFCSSSVANTNVFRPSSFFIIMQTNFGVLLEIQIIPMMQVFVRLDPIFKGQTCGEWMKYKNTLLNVFCLVWAIQTFHCFSTGLCGNFNDLETDDFKVISGITEGTATAFADTWMTQASCPKVQRSFENPCALSIDNGVCFLDFLLLLLLLFITKQNTYVVKQR